MGKWSLPRIATVILFATVCFPIGLGWIVIRGRARDFATLEARIEQSGGGIFGISRQESFLDPFRHMFGSPTVDGLVGYEGYSLRVRDIHASKDALADLLAARPLTKVSAEYARNLDDEWVVGIRDPLAMRSLNLSSTGITDRSVEAILEMRGLQELYLSKTKISDSAAERFISMPELKTLFVDGPNVRAVELLDLHFVDEAGNKPVLLAGRINAVGEVRISGAPGDPHMMNISIDPITEGEKAEPPRPHPSAVFEIGELIESSPGRFKFNVGLVDVPPGRSSVVIHVIYKPTARPLKIWYRLEADPIDFGPSAKGEPVPGRAS